MDSLIARLEAVTFKVTGGGGCDDGEMPITVSEWNTFYETHAQPFVDACNKFDSTKKIAVATEKALKHACVVIEAATQCAKPDQGAFLKFLGPIVDVITAAQDVDNRSESFPQEKAFAEAIQCLNWLMADGSKSVIMAQLDASDFYLSKVLVKARDSESPAKENLRAFVSCLKTMLTEMGEYGNSFHKTGLIWKHGGGSVADFKPGKRSGPAAGPKSSEDRLQNCLSALEAHAAKMGGDDGEGDPPCVSGFNDFFTASVQPFIDACNALEGTKKLGNWAEASFKHMGNVIKATTTSKKPTPEAFMAFLGPIAKSIGDVMALNPMKSSEWFNHETSFSEGLQSLNWLCMDGLPRPYIVGQGEAADFYLTKILTVGKDKPDAEKAAYRAYVASFKKLIEAQAAFAVEFFKTGLTWNPKGGALPAVEAPAAAPEEKPKPAISGAAAAIAAAQLSKAAAGAAKPKPKFALPAKAVPTEGKIDRSQQNKIFIERYDAKLQKEPLVVDVGTGEDAQKTGVFIGNCKGPDLCIQIKGKVKNITISNCHQCGIVFDNCITTVEMIGSKRCQVQAVELAGSYVIDKCDRTQLFLADKSVAEKVVAYSAQSTSTNILHTDPTGEDQEEHAVPDQMMSVFKRGVAPVHEVVIPDAE
eukprot:CAMPEP_0175089126 /NCGR_PEP_ID=MMETSP0086_2-20121207/621_1 /TAXON_ID=136419 /ORGANISM="Unknown Unknown, Strain D1" /LENGTH=644 /DNA_ID=CAMNT_0016361617 /DNA_START=35 /DNA_END=1969 /DNA_ORIENTATION=+